MHFSFFLFLILFLLLFLFSGMTLTGSWWVVGRAHIESFTFSWRCAQIQAFLKEQLYIRLGLRPHCKKSGVLTACVCTSEPQLLPSPSVPDSSRRVRLPKNLRACSDSLLRVSSWVNIVRTQHAC